MAERTAEFDMLGSPESASAREETRTRILAAAIHLLNEGGRDAVTTRAVADAARVQAPTLYRLFGDKEGLLNAVAEHGFAVYFQKKGVRLSGSDPVEDLRTGWDLHVGFGLSNAAIYLLMYANPRPGVRTAAAEVGHRMLLAHIRRVAVTGRLRVSEERAANLFHAAACGTILTLLAMPEGDRDMHLSKMAREAALAAIVTETPGLDRPGPAAAAIALRASLSDSSFVLSEGERCLLAEWLSRLAASE